MIFFHSRQQQIYLHGKNCTMDLGSSWILYGLMVPISTWSSHWKSSIFLEEFLFLVPSSSTYMIPSMPIQASMELKLEVNSMILLIYQKFWKMSWKQLSIISFSFPF